MSELPAGWVVAPLSAISADADQCVPDADETFTYIDIGSIDREAKSISSPQVLAGKDAPSRARKKVFAGDTLVSMTRPNLNAVALVPPALDGQIASTGFDVLRPLKGIDPRWLGYLVRSDDFVGAMSELVQGALYPAVRAKDVRGYVAPVAPSAEQTRIADHLDTLLARIKACNDHLDAIPGLLKRFRQAVLAHAVTGRLTEEWRTTQGGSAGYFASGLWEIPVGWQWASAQDECGFITKGTTPSKDKMQSGQGDIPFIKVYNLGFDGKLDFSIDPTYVSTQTHSEELKRSIARPGDVLMNIVGPPLGKVSVVPNSQPEWNINQAIARFRPGPNLLSDYLAYCLLSSGLVEHAVSQSKATAGQWNLTLEICRALPIPMPPIREQEEIVRAVQACMKAVASIEVQHMSARSQASRLAPQILAKGFSGDLLPQDTDDEPASALLARLAEERNQSSAAPKGRKARARRTERALPTKSSPSKAMSTKSRQDEDVKGQPYLADHLRRLGQPVDAKTLYEASELPVADFYKQLAWEIAEGHVNDTDPLLEPARHAA